MAIDPMIDATGHQLEALQRVGLQPYCDADSWDYDRGGTTVTLNFYDDCSIVLTRATLARDYDDLILNP